MNGIVSGDSDTVRNLLEHGADVNAKDVSGKLHTIIVKMSIYQSICTQHIW